jgi:hypothetical protein
MAPYVTRNDIYRSIRLLQGMRWGLGLHQGDIRLTVVNKTGGKLAPVEESAMLKVSWCLSEASRMVNEACDNLRAVWKDQPEPSLGSVPILGYEERNLAESIEKAKAVQR